MLTYSMPVDLLETESQMLVVVDLPGVSADHLKIDLQGAELNISAQRSSAPVIGISCLLCERPQGSFVRRLTLPPSAKGGAWKHSLENGVLRVEITKSFSQRPRHLPIIVDRTA